MTDPSHSGWSKRGSDARQMAYADQPTMSSRRMVALGIVAVLHVFLGYALITGLALKAVHVITGPMEVKNIEEVKKNEEPPPPPPDLDEIPPYVPPPEVTVESVAPPPQIQIQTVIPRPAPVITVPAPPAPPAPPAGPTTAATPKGKLGATITSDDYPDASLRAEEQGVTSVRYEVNEQGRVSPGSCQVSSSSGFDRLDRRTCELVERRFRFNPALQNGTPVKANRSQSFRWVVPK